MIATIKELENKIEDRKNLETILSEINNCQQSTL